MLISPPVISSFTVIRVPGHINGMLWYFPVVSSGMQRFRSGSACRARARRVRWSSVVME